MSRLVNSLLLVLLGINISLAAENIKIVNACINEAPPNVKVFAGYLDIINDSEKPVELVGASSPVFEKVEFHVTRINDDITSMQQQANIPVPAKSTFSFSPGQYHLMLFNNKQPVRQGDTIPLELVFADGESIHTGMLVKHVVPGEHHHH